MDDAEFQRRQFLEKLGESFLMSVLEEYSGVLPSLGSDLHGFLQNLGSVYQEMKSNSNVANAYDISFSCVPEQRKLTLHFRTATAACGYVWAGILKAIATHIFRVGVTIRVTIYELKSKSQLRYHFCFSLPTNAQLNKAQSLVCFDEAAAAQSPVLSPQSADIDAHDPATVQCQGVTQR